MDYTWVPEQNNFIRVQFELNGTTLWWPSRVTEMSSNGSRRRQTLKVSATLLYNEIKDSTVDYKEETGDVMFINSSILSILDVDGNEATEASWHYDFNVPTQNSTKYAHIINDMAKNSTTVSNGPRIDNLQTEQIGLTTPTHAPTAAIPTTEHSALQNTVTTPLMEIELGKLHGRVESLVKQLSSSCVSSLAKVEDYYITTLKYSLRRKFLEYMQRPLQTYRPRLKTPYSGCFQPHTIRVSIDCDYKQFTHLLRDTRDNFGHSHELLYYPTLLHTHSPTYSTGPLQIIFRTFNAMAKWLLINDSHDIRKLICKVSRTRNLSAAVLLGSTVFGEEQGEQGIDFFPGYSSNSKLTTSPPNNNESSPSTFFRLETSEWDDVNDSFKHVFTKIMNSVDLTVDSDTCTLSNNYFQLIWTALPLTPRSQWSADSTYTGSTLLGTLSLVVPSIEIQGVSMLDQLEIRSTHDPRL